MPSTVWTQRGGDAGHTGYVDVAVNPASFTDAWNQPLNYVGTGTGSWAERAVAIDASHVYRTDLEGYAFNGTYHVIAYDLQTGAMVWNHPITGNAFEGVGEPSVDAGIVYVNRSGHSGISGGTPADLPYVYGLSAATGAQVAQASYQAQWSSHERPVILGSQLIDYNGYYGGMGSWSVPGLAAQWNRSGSIYETPNAAMDATRIYAYGSSTYSTNTQVFSRTNGVVLATLTHPTGMYSYDPVVANTGKVLVSLSGTVGGVQKYGVAAYDAATFSLLWTTNTTTPVPGKAVGNGLVAVTTGPALLLLDEATGAVVRSWQTPTGFALSPDIVLTRTHVFVEATTSGVARVYAINIATGQPEWTFENTLQQEEWGGAYMEMAFGGGYLLLSHDGFVRAFTVATGGNRPPDAVNDTATSPEDTTVNVSVLANDTDADGDTLTVSGITQPAHGAAVLNGNGTVTYTPAANYNGVDSFTYTIDDGHSGTDTATVTISVTAVNDAPVAQNDSYSTNEDTQLTVNAPGVLANDTDVDGNPITAVLVSGPSKGTLTLNANGSFAYTPSANANGTDTFTYKANDGSLNSNVATVTITISAVNDAPVARNDSYTTDEDVPLIVVAPGLLGNDTDPDGDPLSAILVSGPNKGTLTLNANGSFTYTPNANVNGSDSFTYKASDGGLQSNVATVTITINSIEDSPVAAAGPDRTSTEGAPVWFDGTESYDPDGDSITYAWNFGDGGTATGPTPFHYYPDNGTFTVTLTVTDVHGNTGTDTLVLTVTKLAPEARVTGPMTGVRGQPRSFHFTATDVSDVDQASNFTYAINWGDGSGTQSYVATGNLWLDHVYTDLGTYSVTVAVTDKDGATGPTASQSIAINAAEMQGTTLAVGGSVGNDSILIKPSNTLGNLAVTINGVSQGTFRPTGQLLVYGQSGDDTIELQSAKFKGTTATVAVPAILFGDAGNDTINAGGSGAANVLVGGDGSDALTGGSKRDILLGGLGTDVLGGGAGADILIGGATDFDSNLSALTSLMAEWRRSDLGYAGRINHLTGTTSGGLNGTNFLNATTVHDDAAVDPMSGENGQDWFLARPSGSFADIMNDKKNNETVTSI